MLVLRAWNYCASGSKRAGYTYCSTTAAGSKYCIKELVQKEVEKLCLMCVT